MDAGLPKLAAYLAKLGLDFLLIFETSVSTKIDARSDKICARFYADAEQTETFFSVDLFQLLRDDFTIDINLVSDEKVGR